MNIAGAMRFSWCMLAILVCLCVVGLNCSSAWAECMIYMDGQTVLSTQETSRTIEAAQEAFPYMPGAGSATPNIIGSSCVRYYLHWDYIAVHMDKTMCIDGSWYFEYYCWSSPGCMDSYTYYGGTWDVVCDCEQESDCTEGYTCVVGVCEPIPDDPPVIGDGPLVASDWKVLPASVESPRYINENTSFLWAFSDDYASCQEDCTHTAEYQAVGESTWTALTVSSDAEQSYAWVDLPVDQLQNATTYAFRLSITDCAGQTTESNTYYFRVATSDAPPVIGDGPLLTDSWQVMPVSSSRATLLDQATGVLWTFSDDYASCSGLCTHRARYRRVGDTAWTWIPVETDPDGDWYAYTTLPVGSLAEGVYQFRFDVRDCAGQLTGSKVYYFKVE